MSSASASDVDGDSFNVFGRYTSISSPLKATTIALNTYDAVLDRYTATTDFLTVGGLYVVSYYALDSKGGISPTKSAYVTVTDDSAPGDVSDLGVYSESVGGLTLSWSPSASSDATGYRVYQRFTGAGSYSLVEQVTANSSEISGLSSVRVYDFKVTTVDGSGNESIGVELTTDADGLGYYWEIDNLAAGCEQSAAGNCGPSGSWGDSFSNLQAYQCFAGTVFTDDSCYAGPQVPRGLGSAQSERLRAPVV